MRLAQSKHREIRDDWQRFAVPPSQIVALLFLCSLKTELNDRRVEFEERREEEKEEEEKRRTRLNFIQRLKGQLIELRPTIDGKAQQTLRVGLQPCQRVSSSSLVLATRRGLS